MSIIQSLDLTNVGYDLVLLACVSMLLGRNAQWQLAPAAVHVLTEFENSA